MLPSRPYCHGEPYADYFARLAADERPAAGLRRLLTHLDADLDGTERLALWRALWTAWRRLAPAQHPTVAAALDGRHAPALSALHLDWADPALVEHLATHTAGAAQTSFVPVLLAHHGLDPLDEPSRVSPGLVLLAARAALAADPPRLQADDIARVQAATLAAAERDAQRLPQGLALLFELALQAADADTATGVLAELLNHGHVQQLRPDRIRAWLDGTAFIDDEDAQRPLLLAAPWQRQWLQPARWRQRAVLQALYGALQRPGPRQRLAALASLVVELPPQPDAVPRREALELLSMLDQGHARLDAGEDAVPALRHLLDRSLLAPAAAAALWRGSARCHAAQHDIEGQRLALTQARRQQPTPVLRAALSDLLPEPPAFGNDWCDEEPYWTRLLGQADPALARLAALQLAQLWTDGLLEPRPPRRCQRLAQAHELWQRLAAEPRYAAFADAALRHPTQTVMRPALQRHAGEDFLWFECPDARRVTVVFSCIATHPTFAEVGTLVGKLPGQHLLFVRCPDKNWYCDDSFERVRTLLADRVASRFAPGDVTCWYGSMGGHGALKFALEFGWRAVVFNPQTDLDLWAAFRPRERGLLWGATRHARLSDWPRPAWEQLTLYYACGAATSDREALSVVIAQLRQCRQLTAIIEKFDDTDHAGLMSRIAGGPVHRALVRIGQRLDTLQGQVAAEPVAAADQAAFWDRLDAARTLKLEITVRDGQLHWQPSLACTPGIG